MWLLSVQESIIHLSDSTAAVRFTCIITFTLIFTLLAIYLAKMYLSTRSVLTGNISVLHQLYLSVSVKHNTVNVQKVSAKMDGLPSPKETIPSWTSDLSLIVSPPKKNKVDWICTVYTLLPTWKIGLELQTLS